MSSSLDKFNVVVAGHICLDVIPDLDHLPEGSFASLFQPGQIVSAGPVAFSTGGLVSNTGQALYHLGIPTRLVAKVGDDLFGSMVIHLVRRIHPSLAEGLAASEADTTSYSVIINPPGVDRIFLHCPGANDTFCAQDMDYSLLAEASLFHFGYPPLMRRMYADDGQELVKIFKQAKATGVTTSLDMAFPDPSSEGGKANWSKILLSVLPDVDLFQPSVEELLFMLRRKEYERLANQSSRGDVLAGVTPELLSSLAEELISMGVKVVVLKVGARGLYLRTARAAALGGMGRAAPTDLSGWANQELWAPCFRVNVAGTTGSGDATIAGFISALLRDFLPRQAVTAAVAVGACNVEAADALSGLRSWDDTLIRVAAGWERLPLDLHAAGWQWSEVDHLWTGPAV